MCNSVCHFETLWWLYESVAYILRQLIKQALLAFKNKMGQSCSKNIFSEHIILSDFHPCPKKVSKKKSQLNPLVLAEWQVVNQWPLGSFCRKTLQLLGVYSNFMVSFYLFCCSRYFDLKKLQWLMNFEHVT